MLPGLLALLENVVAEGAAGGGSMALTGEGGAMATLSKMFSGESGFSSSQHLGQGLRQISDLKATIEAAKEAMASKGQQQESIAARARDDEKQFAFSDPGHQQQLAQLAREQQEHAAAMQQSQRQLAQLQNRAAMSLDPRAASLSRLGRAAAIGGVGTAIGNSLPTMAANAPGVQAASNVFNFAGGPAANIATEMAGTPLKAAGGVISGAAQGAALGSLGGPVGTGLGAAIGGLAGAANELSQLPANIVKWDEALLASQRHLGQFSGVIALADAEARRRGIVRDIASGQATGGTTADLSRKLQDLHDTLRPIKDDVMKMTAIFLGGATDILKMSVEHMAEIKAGLAILSPKIGLILNAAEVMRDLMLKDAKAGGGDGDSISQRLFRDIQTHDLRKPRDVPRR